MTDQVRSLAGVRFRIDRRPPLKEQRRIDGPVIQLYRRSKPFPFRASRPKKNYLFRRLSDGSLYFAWPRAGKYWIRPDFRRIEYLLPAGISEEFLWDSVEGPLVSFFLALEGTPLFHGSAVNVKGKAAVFMAESGSGKSTLAAAFAHRGFPLISDDVIRFKRRKSFMEVWPGARGISLWPKSAKVLRKDHRLLPGVLPGAKKRKLAENILPGGMETRPVPVSRIFTFKRSRSCRKPRITQLSSREKWETLAKHLYLILPKDAQFVSAAFRELNLLASRTPVTQLIIPDRLKSLDSTVDFILEQVTSCHSPRSPVAKSVRTSLAGLLAERRGI